MVGVVKFKIIIVLLVNFLKTFMSFDKILQLG